MFYKGFNSKLQGYGDYQFEIGKTHSSITKDNFVWFHYAEYLSATLVHFEADIRICLVTPLGETRYFKGGLDGVGKGYYTTNKILIDRELTRREIFEIFGNEEFSFYLLLKLNPPFEVLVKYKMKIFKYSDSVLQMKHLTKEQKLFLLPKVCHKYIDLYPAAF